MFDTTALEAPDHDVLASTTQPAVRLSDQYVKRALAGFSALDAIAERGGAVYPCGIKQLDRWIDGGFSPGSLTLLAARPNSGKTLALSKIVRGMLSERENVIIVACALDDTALTFNARWLAMESHLSIAKVRDNRKRTPEEHAHLLTVRETIAQTYLNRMVVLGASDIQSDITRLEEALKAIYRDAAESSTMRPQLVVTLDSPRNLDWSSVPGLVGNPSAMTEHAGRRVKALLDLTVDGQSVEPIIFCTEHLKKLAKEVKRPGPDDIKDSIGPQYDGNLILMLWNDLAYSTTVLRQQSDLYFERTDLPPVNAYGDLRRDPVVELTIAKNKMGAMDYNAGMNTALFKMYQEQSRMDAVTDPEEYLRYGQAIRQ